GFQATQEIGAGSDGVDKERHFAAIGRVDDPTVQHGLALLGERVLRALPVRYADLAHLLHEFVLLEPAQDPVHGAALCAPAPTAHPVHLLTHSVTRAYVLSDHR